MLVGNESKKSRDLIAGALVVVSIAAAGFSMLMNFRSGASYAAAPDEAWLAGSVSLVFDAIKTIGLMVVTILWRHKLRLGATAALVLWSWCVVVSLGAAIGYSAQGRMNAVGGREAWNVRYEEATRELTRAQSQLKKLREHRSVGEVEAAIKAKLGRVIGSSERVRGTVASISNDCRTPEERTRSDCMAVATLQEELAVAEEAERIEQTVDGLKKEIATTRDHGGMVSANPQAEVLAWLTRGYLSAREVGFTMPVMFAGLIEAVSAFGLWLAFLVWSVSSKPDTPKPARASPVELEPVEARRGSTELVVSNPVEVVAEDGDVETVLAYLIDATAPTADAGAIGAGDLHTDYRRWCGTTAATPLSRAAFVREFDRLRARNAELSCVQKFGERYYGLHIEDRQMRVLPAPKRKRG